MSVAAIIADALARAARHDAHSCTAVLLAASQLRNALAPGGFFGGSLLRRLARVSFFGGFWSIFDFRSFSREKPVLSPSDFLTKNFRAKKVKSLHENTSISIKL